ncbi:uncharacterized protein LOC112450844 isoform X2 [Kryptolebias marmoratus]|uniref:uncharacterized protein LOC112450844 isoform X2 n=1 Tax=Kryptolebias marmoratus TaxID=37003 RepID=UPI0018ACBD3F|nr:uncharacterized protein LOC112450844 isoform X2 [Kryptolebias marmoratus]
MDLEESAAALQAENHHLAQENDQLRTMLGLLRENVDLKARMQSRHLDDTLAPGTRQSNLWQHTFDERQFRRDLRRSKSRPEPRTSSPVDFKSFLQSSAPRDADETAELRADAPLCVAGNDGGCRRKQVIKFRSTKTARRDRLSAGQEDPVPCLPGSQAALRIYSAQYTREDYRGEHSPFDGEGGRGLPAPPHPEVHRPYGQTEPAWLQSSTSPSVL